MKIYSQLEKAQLENLTVLPTAGIYGRVVYKTNDGNIYFDNGTLYRALLANNDKAIIGNHATPANNVRFNRAANTILQLVPGNDATAEGSQAAALGQISARQETYIYANLPSAGNLGRIAWASDQGFLQVDNGTFWRGIVDDFTSQVVSNKTLTSITFTNPLTWQQNTTPANPTSGYNKIYFKNDNKLYTLDSAGNEAAVGSGSGGGVKNLIVNGSADDTSTSIFVPYLNTAQRLPVTGSGGSPTVTTSVTSTLPLDGTKSYLLTKGATNCQGQGWAIPYTVPLAYRAKVMNITVDYIVNSGTFAAGSTTADSDVIWYLYDITNSVLIEPTSIKMLSNSSTVSDKFQSTFQTSATGASYRLIAHIASTNAVAYELKVDNITVSPSDYVYGTPITDFVAYTPTLTGFGTATNLNFRSRKIGDSLQVIGSFQAGNGGSPPTAVLAQITLGYAGANANVTSSSVLTTGGQIVGSGNINVAITTNFSGITVIAQPSLNYVNLGNESSSFPGTQLLNGNTLMSASNVMHVNFTVPITGWVSSVQMSDSYDSQDVLFDIRTFSGTIGTSAATWTTLTFTTVTFDTIAGFNGSDTWRAPASGYYRIKILSSANTAAAAYFDVGYRIDSGTDVLMARGLGTATAAAVVTGTDTVYLRAGQTIQARALTEGTQGINLRRLTIEKVQSPKTIGQVEKNTLSVSGSSTTAAGAATTILFNTVEENSHGNWASNEYTVQTAGWYYIDLHVRHTTSGTATVNQYSLCYIQTDVGGGYATRRQGFKYVESTGIGAWSSSASYLKYFKSGDKIRAQHETNITSPQIGTSSSDTYMQIFKL